MRDQTSWDVLWCFFEVMKSNAKSEALDTLTFYVLQVGKPLGFGKRKETRKRTTLAVMV